MSRPSPKAITRYVVSTAFRIYSQKIFANLKYPFRMVAALVIVLLLLKLIPLGLL